MMTPLGKLYAETVIMLHGYTWEEAKQIVAEWEELYCQKDDTSTP